MRGVISFHWGPFCMKWFPVPHHLIGQTPVDTMAAILHEDPPQLSSQEHGDSSR